MQQPPRGETLPKARAETQIRSLSRTSVEAIDFVRALVNECGRALYPPRQIVPERTLSNEYEETGSGEREELAARDVRCAGLNQFGDTGLESSLRLFPEIPAPVAPGITPEEWHRIRRAVSLVGDCPSTYPAPLSRRSRSWGTRGFRPARRASSPGYDSCTASRCCAGLCVRLRRVLSLASHRHTSSKSSHTCSEAPVPFLASCGLKGLKPGASTPERTLVMRRSRAQ